MMAASAPSGLVALVGPTERFVSCVSVHHVRIARGIQRDGHTSIESENASITPAATPTNVASPLRSQTQRNGPISRLGKLRMPTTMPVATNSATAPATSKAAVKPRLKSRSQNAPSSPKIAPGTSVSGIHSFSTYRWRAIGDGRLRPYFKT